MEPKLLDEDSHLLTENQVKEELSIAYLHAIAAKAGFSCEKLRVDMDSIDIIIGANGLLDKDSTLYSPEIKLQLKASSVILPTHGLIHFQLPIKNYNDLRHKSTSPRLLALLLLPDNAAEWLEHTEDELILKKCVYWLNLYGMPDTDNQVTITVKIPTANVLSPNIIKDLMLKASKEDL